MSPVALPAAPGQRLRSQQNSPRWSWDQGAGLELCAVKSRTGGSVSLRVPRTEVPWVPGRAASYGSPVLLVALAGSALCRRHPGVRAPGCLLLVEFAHKHDDVLCRKLTPGERRQFPLARQVVPAPLPKAPQSVPAEPVPSGCRQRAETAAHTSTAVLLDAGMRSSMPAQTAPQWAAVQWPADRPQAWPRPVLHKPGAAPGLGSQVGLCVPPVVQWAESEATPGVWGAQRGHAQGL